MLWFVRDGGRFLSQTRAHSLDQLSATVLDAYLAGMVRSQRTADWQRRQTVDALRRFGRVCRLNRAFDVDRDEWAASAEEIGVRLTFIPVQVVPGCLGMR